MLNLRKLTKINRRYFSKYLDKDRTSKAIRQKFLDYFINQHNHNFVRSSPVVPYCDPTVAFVNAGMNQFKSVFIGHQEPQYRRVANSQKCVRVGGKHNDLEVVGTDGYHHTFFEMLGNWSFGDYFKKEACEMAWNLLTKEYKIPPSRLYVTYFQGDKTLGIEADLETKEIWKSLGIPEDRILPFSSKDNFWEMGTTGPCGPCTEIHIDHITDVNRANFINKGLHDLTELWNIVFIQYNRKNDKSIDVLPQKHIDTGMGFERLVAVLQGKISNYDTDNFTYLLNAIHKNCSNVPSYKGNFGEKDWNNLDTSYRMLADYSRMITVCLADGIIPEQNQKLRRIIRKALLLSETTFKKNEGLLKELSNYVIEHLGSVYNELERNAQQIHQIIDYEEEIYKNIRKSASQEWEKLVEKNPKLAALDVIETPNLILAYKELENMNLNQIIDKQLAFKLYDTFGLDENLIRQLSDIFGLSFNVNDLQDELDLARNRSKEQTLQQQNKTGRVIEKLIELKIPKTNTIKRYEYRKEDNNYVFDDLDVKIIAIVDGGNIVQQIDKRTDCYLIFDKTNVYSEAGGQISDRATINLNGNPFKIDSIEEYNGYVLHKISMKSATKSEFTAIKQNDKATIIIDKDFRLNNMKNHTAVHLLNASLKETKGATCQKSSKVTNNYLNLDLGIFSSKISNDEIDIVEKSINDLIKTDVPVNISVIDSQKLSSLDYVTLIPGEIYPDTGIRIVEIKGHHGFISREPCCGTHVLSTADIGEFCVVVLKSLGRSTVSIYGVTGERAKQARIYGEEFFNNLKNLEENLHMIKLEDVANLKQKLNYNIDDSWIIPFSIKQHCLERLDRISKQIKDTTKGKVKDFIEKEIKNVLKTNITTTKHNQKYLIHCLNHQVDGIGNESIQLQKATKLCPDLPVLVISYCDNVVKARCCVPEELAGSFSAEKWMKESVGSIFKGTIAPPKGQNGNYVCNMKPKKINGNSEILLKESVEAARKYIEDHL